MIHQYKLSGYNIVLDVYSGSVHAVDDVAYDAIALIDQGSSREQAAAALAKKYADRADVTAADISDVLDDIDELTAAGQLFAPDATPTMPLTSKPLQRCQGALPARRPHLQPELQLLLRRAGQVPRRGRSHEL